MTFLFFLYICISIVITILSYGFVDANLLLTNNTAINSFIRPLQEIVQNQGVKTAIVYTSIVSTLYVLYGLILSKNIPKNYPLKKIVFFITSIGIALIVSYPALTYDIFNYITTAKVTYYWGENPYLVMPIEILHEPYLSFTRAANKLALYGPTWILFSFIPYTLGQGAIWQTILTFKVSNLICYFILLFAIYKSTNNIKNVLFFACNPLVLIEILVSGHNDIFMMVLVSLGILYVTMRSMWVKILGYVLIAVSVFVKGATIMIVPLLCIKKITKEQVFYWGMILLFLVNVVLGPIREELYPWYFVWTLSFLSFLPITKYKKYFVLAYAMCIGLSMRHAPYMATGSYLGISKTLRTIFTIVPPAAVFAWFLWQKFRRSRI